MSESDDIRQLKSTAWLPIVLGMVLIAIHLLQVNLDHNWYRWGIFPKEFFGLRGIVVAPFIHGSWSHLLSNIFPLMISGWMILVFYPKIAGKVLFFSYLLTGFLVWLIARPVFHIGASGVVYAWVAFILWTGIFKKNRRSIALAGIILALFGGMWATDIAPKDGVSWESHVLGAMSGVFFAYFYKEVVELDEQDEKIVFSDTDKEYFLPRDIFEKTKLQRQQEEEERLRQEEQQRIWDAYLRLQQSQPGIFPNWFTNHS